MHKIIEDNLKTAFAGESQARMKYVIFADVAEKEGKPNIAKLFRAVAFAEQVHAKSHLKVLGGVKDTLANLETAMSGETFEVEEMYPAYVEQAKQQGEKDAVRANHYALEAEKIHAAMYADAKAAASAGKDIELGDMYICSVCGHTVEGKAPAVCPICGAKEKAFKRFS